MENMVIQPGRALAGRQVFVTGHTGFKGSWLAHWLHLAGCHVHGYALDPPTHPNHFSVSRVAGMLASDTRADLADVGTLRRALLAANPEVVFHLAAQPLVRQSYRDPLETWRTNVMGTAHLMEVIRGAPTVRAVVVATTDKVYRNDESGRPYAEDAALGGHDPYSASKAACEILVDSFRQSFYADGGARVATARAGNVIGGGDWAADRLVPDCIASFSRHEPVILRYPRAVRPWQHVLEPLGGYMRLASALLRDDGEAYAKAWNFGPDERDDAEVGKVAELLAALWGADARVVILPEPGQVHEAGVLRLDSRAACAGLGWHPRWRLGEALKATLDWYLAHAGGADMARVSRDQIEAFEQSGAL
jgi:CDP-glucose 4,6-dehydratase